MSFVLTLRHAALIAVALVLSVVFTGQAFAADKGDWKLLGQAAVEKGEAADEIVVGAKEGKLQKLKFEAKGGAVELKGIRVFYADGTDQELNVTDKLKAGQETEAKELKGNEARVVTKIVIKYKADSDKSRAVIVAYGK